VLRRHQGLVAGTVGLYALAAAAGLAGPRLLGDVVQAVVEGTTTGHVSQLAVALLGFVVLQSLLTRSATIQGGKLTQTILAEMREEFVDRVLALPLSAAEDAGSGDLVSRASQDVDSLGRSAQYAMPQILAGVMITVLTVIGMVAASPGLAAVMLIAVPPLALCTRWYLHRSAAAYLAYAAASAEITEELSASLSGAATVEALGLGSRRVRAGDESVAAAYAAELATLRLRTVFLPVTEIGYRLPTIAALLLGGVFYSRNWASLSAITAVVLYAQQVTQPIQSAREWLQTVQGSLASLSRLLGVAQVPLDREVGEQEVTGLRDLVADKVTFAYDDGPDVLHRIDLTVRQGERLTMVGASGAGKSTLGRLMAGINGPRSGSVRLGGASLVELPLDRLRGEVALVSHEQYVFAGTLRENLELAAPNGSAPGDDELWSALSTVGARDWAEALPDKLDARVGPGGADLDPAQCQQLSIARLLIADPRVLVLDEATSLLDPRSARQLERTLNALLEGRTVIAIAHRLQTAHDADRIAVVEDGRVIELGSHTDLIAADGAYTRLWTSWHGAPISDLEKDRL
jgi:ABC-type multidrug transport system fused ATPase/permease subunit